MVDWHNERRKLGVFSSFVIQLGNVTRLALSERCCVNRKKSTELVSANEARNIRPTFLWHWPFPKLHRPHYAESRGLWQQVKRKKIRANLASTFLLKFPSGMRMEDLTNFSRVISRWTRIAAEAEIKTSMKKPTQRQMVRLNASHFDGIVLAATYWLLIINNNPRGEIQSSGRDNGLAEDQLGTERCSNRKWRPIHCNLNSALMMGV